MNRWHALILGIMIVSLSVTSCIFENARAQDLRYYDGARDTRTLENRQQWRSQQFWDTPSRQVPQEEYWSNRDRAYESARVVTGYEDAERILRHGIDAHGVMDAEGLREAGVSERGFNQLMDDARLGY
jgi:hypothetical protein